MSQDQQQRRAFVLGHLDEAIKVARNYIERVGSYGASALVGFLPDLERQRALFANASAHDAAPTIVTINGQKSEMPSAWTPLYVSYALVVQLAGYDPKRILSVVYRQGHLAKPEGILAPGESVEVVLG